MSQPLNFLRFVTLNYVSLRIVLFTLIFAVYFPADGLAATKFDFGDGPRADYVYFHPAGSSYWFGYAAGPLPGSTGDVVADGFWPGNRIAPADYNGDGFTDFAVFNAGSWTIKYSMDLGGAITGGTVATDGLGTAGDIPQSANFIGSADAEIAVFRPGTAEWFIKPVGGVPLSPVVFGVPGDKPVTEDYDGDGFSDLAVFHPATGTWTIRPSSSPTSTIIVNWGVSTDTPVPADYDGDGKADIAVYRPSMGFWFILLSTGPAFATAWGNATDLPVPADYDGDGKADIAIYRSGDWWINIGGWPVMYGLGSSVDEPVPHAYIQ